MDTLPLEIAPLETWMKHFSEEAEKSEVFEALLATEVGDFAIKIMSAYVELVKFSPRNSGSQPTASGSQPTQTPEYPMYAQAMINQGFLIKPNASYKARRKASTLCREKPITPQERYETNWADWWMKMGGFRQRGWVRYAGCLGVRARVGECLELEFRQIWIGRAGRN